MGRIDLDREVLAAQATASPTALDALLAAEAALDRSRRRVVHRDAVKEALESEQSRQAWKPRPFLMPVRVAISGKTQTPPLFPIARRPGPRTKPQTPPRRDRSPRISGTPLTALCPCLLSSASVPLSGPSLSPLSLRDFLCPGKGAAQRGRQRKTVLRFAHQMLS